MLFGSGSGPHLPELFGHRDRVERVQFGRTGTRVLSASRDRTGRIWDIADGRSCAVLAHEHPVRTRASLPMACAS